LEARWAAPRPPPSSSAGRRTGADFQASLDASFPAGMYSPSLHAPRQGIFFFEVTEGSNDRVAWN
jgi:hypothetical protein